MLKNTLAAVYVIWLRDLKKYWREKPRVITSILQPILWLFIMMGIGIVSSITAKGTGVNYVQYIFPGIISMTIMFSAMNSGLSFASDRESGFMKEILVSPANRGAIVLGRMLAGTTTAMCQGLLALCFAPLIGQSLTIPMILQTFGYMLLLAVAMSAIGILIGCRVASFQSYLFISNFIMTLLFFLSGAMFPLDIMPLWMQFLARFNPLSYGVDLIRHGLLAGPLNTTHDLTVLLLTILLMTGLSIRILKRME